MYCTLKTLVQPTSRVVTGATLAQHLRLDSDTDEDLALHYVDVATRWVEQYIDRALITTQFEFLISSGVSPQQIENPFQTGLWYWPYSYQYSNPRQIIELPRGRVQSIQTIDSLDNTFTWNPAQYQAMLDLEPAQVLMTAPVLGSSVSTATRIRFTAGYGVPNNVPVQIKHAVLMLSSYFYEHRGDVDTDIPRSITRLLTSDRLVSFG